MRLALVSLATPYSRASWSGIPYSIHQELLGRGHDISVIDTPWTDYFLNTCFAISNRKYFTARSMTSLKYFGDILRRKLDRIAPDYVVSINAPHKIARAARDWPTVYVTDALFGSVAGMYPRYSRLTKQSLRTSNAVEELVLSECKAALVASEWARENAFRLYGDAASNVHTVPMGANVVAPPSSPYERRTSEPLILLFVGYDWERKGGEKVLATFELIRREAPDAELHIVGCRPGVSAASRGIVIHGRMMKDNPQHQQLLNQLYSQSTFFFMPSQQETYGIVYCEACAFWLPPVAANVGGVGTIIKHSENGILLDPGASPRDYASNILNVWRDKACYETMCRSARSAFDTTLSWKSWGDRFDEILLQGLKRA